MIHSFGRGSFCWFAKTVAVQIASRCQMDIMSLAYLSVGTEGDECLTTVVYVNNGRSLADIRRIMAPEINNNPQSYWMILDIYEWQGMLDCEVSTRGTDEEWKIASPPESDFLEEL